MSASIGTLFRTIARLTPKQIVVRPYARIAPRLATSLPLRFRRTDGADLRVQEWANEAGAPDEPASIAEARELLAGSASHCGVTITVTGFSFQPPSRLWTYEFHYRRWLAGLALLCRSGEIAVSNVMNSWREADGADATALWEPYVLSRRLFSEALALGSVVDQLPKAFSSERLSTIAREVAVLEVETESHLQGNHELARAAALATIRLLLAPHRAKRSSQRYRFILTAQIDRDGLHEERSPAYHLVALGDLRRVIAALNISAAEEQWSAAIATHLVSLNQQMTEALATVLHPDGSLPMFHDSPASVSPSAADFAIAAADTRGAYDLTASGICGWRGLIMGEPGHLIADYGPPRPDHQPGHQHAAPFAFELWWGGLLFTSAGVSTYEPTRRRRFERGAAAHTSIRVNGDDPAEVWSSFRMGRGFSIRDRTVNADKGFFRCSAAHDGFIGKLHRRTIELRADGVLNIADEVSGRGKGRMEVFFPIGPGWSVEAVDNSVAITSGSRRVSVSSSGSICIDRDFEVAVRFGERERATCLIVSHAGDLPVHIDTRFDLKSTA